MERLTDAVLLRMEKQGLAGDLYVEGSVRHEAAVQDGRVERLSSSDSFGMGIRVFKDGLMGFGFTTVNDAQAAVALVDSLAASAAVKGYGCYRLPGPEPAALMELCDAGFEGMSAEKLSGPALGLEAAAASVKGVKYVRDASLTAVRTTVSYRNTSGMKGAFDRTMYTAFLTAISSGRSGDEAVDNMETSAVLNRIDMAAAGRDAGSRAARLTDGAPVATGRYKLVLPPHAAVDFLYVLSPMFYGSNARKGKSLLKDCAEGDIVASSIVGITDSALLPMGAASGPFDGEGSPSRETRLVSGGKFSGFLYDAYNASLMKKRPTGNGVRAGFKSLPETGITNFFLEAGQTGAASIAGSGTCVVVNSLMGLHMTDTVSGNFSLGINGWLYRDGSQVQPVKECLITGNVREFLMNISAVGDDLKFYGSFGSPTVAVDNIMIAGK